MFLSGMLARGRTRVKTDLLTLLSRRFRWLPAAAWMGGIFYLSNQSAPLAGAGGGGSAVAAHLALYTGLAFLLCWALAAGGGSRADTPAWALAIVTFALTVLYGVMDEIHQAFVPGRNASEADLLLDAVGAALGIAFALAVQRLLKANRRNL